MRNNEINTCSQRAVWRNGGIIPQTILWEIARYFPAASSVEVATAPSRRDVMCNVGTARTNSKN
jgi:hypothetical protein